MNQPETPDPLHAFARETAEKLKCQHLDRTGGNDYMLCNTCGWSWDYRRQTATESIILAALRQAQQVQREEMKAKALEWWDRCMVQGFSGDQISSILEDFGLNEALHDRDDLFKQRAAATLRSQETP